MNRNSSESRVRYGLSRKLSCERLEQRALLAAIFASAELPASTPEALETETRAFIAETIEQFSQASGVLPEQSHVSTGRVMELNGQAVKVTDLVVEFGPIWKETSQTAPSPPRALTFSFIVLPNRAVSVRATISNEFGISAPALTDLSSPSASLPARRLADLPQDAAWPTVKEMKGEIQEFASDSLLVAKASKTQPEIGRAVEQVVHHPSMAARPERIEMLSAGATLFELEPPRIERGKLEGVHPLSVEEMISDLDSIGDVRLAGEGSRAVVLPASGPAAIATSRPGLFSVPEGMVLVDAQDVPASAVLQSQRTVGGTALFQVFVSPLLRQMKTTLPQVIAVVAEEPEYTSSAGAWPVPAEMILVTASATWLFRSRFRDTRVEPQYMITGLPKIGFLCHQDY